MFVTLSRSSPVQTMHRYLISLGNIGLLLRLCIETQSCNIILQQKVAVVVAISPPEARGSWNCVRFPGSSVGNGLCREHPTTGQDERRRWGCGRALRSALGTGVALPLVCSVACTRIVLAGIKVKGRNDCSASQKRLAFIEGSVAKI